MSSWESRGTLGMPKGSIVSDLGVLRPLGVLLGSLGAILGLSWEAFIGILWDFGGDFGARNASLKRFAEILTNQQKQCNVLQATRFGGTAIDENMSLEG